MYYIYWKMFRYTGKILDKVSSHLGTTLPFFHSDGKTVVLMQ